MFKILVLKSLYNLSDDNTELFIRDRLSFREFLGLGFSDRVPDVRTIVFLRKCLKSKIGNVIFLNGSMKNYRVKSSVRCRVKSENKKNEWAMKRCEQSAENVPPSGSE
ncbi:MAG: transposase [Planctomycetaceae bacterium]|jgi:IS5 family transposase|nr:transposase [Planctomycetaceae bacterium]